MNKTMFKSYRTMPFNPIFNKGAIMLKSIFNAVGVAAFVAALFALPAWSQAGTDEDEDEEWDTSFTDEPDDGGILIGVGVETGQPAEPKHPGWKYVPGTYLVTSKWGQGAPYNSQVPKEDGKLGLNCATAAKAQIMNYHKWPPYTTDTIPAIIGDADRISTPALPPVTIDWDNMADVYNVTTTEKQKNAVAELYNLALSTGIGISGSAGEFVKYLDYDYGAKGLSRNSYTKEEWKTILKDQIDQGLPVIYAGKLLDADSNVLSGHVFIIDGYNVSGEFHVNMGFSNNGKSDGFYDLYSDDFRWPHNQSMRINIKPGIGPEYDLRRAVKKGGKHILEADIDGKDKMEAMLDIRNDFILDLNGHTLTIDVQYKTLGSDGIKIASGKTFTVMDSKSGGVLNVITPYLNGAGINTADGTLIIESGTVNATTSGYGAGIGGGNGESGGEITIRGGTVNATGGTRGAGIGGGNGSAGGKIIITGGTVTAIGGNYGAGIGGGYGVGGNGGEITINGGTVTATGGSYSAGIGSGRDGTGGTITITDGTVTAIGGGAGIGGGRNSGGSEYSGEGGDITITGGTVTATGSSNSAGIGSGYYGNGGNVTISGGTVTATGDQYAAGIGSGRDGAGGTITITGGTVTAIGGDAGIGGGRNSSGGEYSGSGGTITITGGIVTATGNNNSAGIGGGSNGGAGGNITINGGTVTATGNGSAAGIGNGRNGAAGTLAMDGNALVFTNSIGDATAKTSGILVIGNTTNWYGEDVITLSPTDYAIPSEKTLTIQNGKTLEIPSGAMLTNNGTIANNGTISNNGKITLCGGTLLGNSVEGNQPISTCPATITAHPTGGTAIIGTTFSLSVTATSPDNGTLSYQWFIKTPEGEANAIAGATNATYAAPTSAVGTYKYFVVVTNTVDGSVPVASNVATLTVTEAIVPILSPKIAINRLITPTRNGINFASKANATIAVYSMSGKLVSKQIYNAGSHSISFEHLPKGMYIVKASFGSRNEVLRVAVR